MKVVSPYRPFVPESPAHLRLGPFDWIHALDMLSASVRRSCACETFAITDVDTDLAVPSYQYVTTERRLMLWILDVSLQYLQSDDFDQDTVLVSPDTLVLGPLQRWFVGSADLGVLARHKLKFVNKPILNGAQWWAVKGKAHLIAFYEQALALARTLPENLLRWGADTEPFVQLLSPLQHGSAYRAGLVVQFIDATTVRPHVILDFKGQRKHEMASYFARVVAP